MAQVRVRAVANVMGLRRGDVGDVETGSPHVDAMINRGYLEVLEYLPDPEPVVPRAKQFAPPKSFGAAKVVDPDFDKKNWVAPVGGVEEVPEVKSSGKANSSKGRSRVSRPRSTAASRAAGNAGDDSDAGSGVSDGAGGHGEPAGTASDGSSDQ